MAVGLITTLLMTGMSVTPTAAHPRAAVVASIAPNTFRNPIRDHAPDPSLLYHQGSYYLTYTAGSRIVITKTSSLTEIQQAAETVVWDDDTPSRCCNMWAPELRLLGGRWYIYYSADDMTRSGGREDMDISHHRMYVLESTGSGGADPMGPYTFKGELDTSTDAAAIDGTVWEQPDQSLYFIWSGAYGTSGNTQNIYIAPMRDPWTISGQRVLISQPEYEWEALRRRQRRHPGRINEAPAILRHDGKVFLTYSAGGCANYDYTLGLLTLTGSDPLDATSWAKSPNPVFTYSADHWVWAPGSNGFFSSPDGSETWLVYHALSSSDGAPVGECSDNRSTRVQKVFFNADGTPDFGEPMASWQSTTLPSGDPGARIVGDGRYLITAAAGGKSLETKGCVTTRDDESPLAVDVWEYQAQRCQEWDLEYLGDGSYKLAEVGSDRALEVRDCREDNSAPVTVHRYRGADCQKWYLDSLGQDVYRISSGASGKSLDVSGCSPDNGSDVTVWPYWSDVNTARQCQRWQLRKVGEK